MVRAKGKFDGVFDGMKHGVRSLTHLNGINFAFDVNHGILATEHVHTLPKRRVVKHDPTLVFVVFYAPLIPLESCLSGLFGFERARLRTRLGRGRLPARRRRQRSVTS